MRRLAIIVSTSPGSGDLDLALGLAAAAIAAGTDVGLFVMSAAVAGLPSRRSALSHLAEACAELVCCATSATALGLDEADVAMTLGGQDDHAALVHRAGRVAAFT